MILADGAAKGTLTDHSPLSTLEDGPACESIGEYELIEVLGHGGMGTVYRAAPFEGPTDAVVAIKVLPVWRSHDPSVVSRFQREASAMARLEHPGIVRLLGQGFDEDSKRYYLVMEFAGERTLRDVVRTEELLPVDEALDLFDAVADAVGYAHQRGVVHRDLKPSNILLDDAGQVRVTDFGIAVLIRGEGAQRTRFTRSQAALGTPYYMAPEQYLDARKVTRHADIYSLGVLLYELITGEPPVGSFEAPGRRRPGLLAGLDELILDMLRRDPTRRPDTVEQVRARLQALRRPRRAYGRGLWAAAVAASLMVGGAAAAWTLGPVLSGGTENGAEDGAAFSEETGAASPERRGVPAPVSLARLRDGAASLEPLGGWGSADDAEPASGTSDPEPRRAPSEGGDFVPAPAEPERHTPAEPGEPTGSTPTGPEGDTDSPGTARADRASLRQESWLDEPPLDLENAVERVGPRLSIGWGELRSGSGVELVEDPDLASGPAALSVEELEDGLPQEVASGEVSVEVVPESDWGLFDSADEELLLNRPVDQRSARGALPMAESEDAELDLLNLDALVPSDESVPVGGGEWAGRTGRLTVGYLVDPHNDRKIQVPRGSRVTVIRRRLDGMLLVSWEGRRGVIRPGALDVD